jgi:ribosomal protein S12
VGGSLADGVLCLISETNITQMKLGFNDTSPAGRALCTRAVEQRNRQPSSSGRPKIRVSFI